LVKQELNIENVYFETGELFEVKIDTNLTPELLEKGKVREIIRSIQAARKEAECLIDEKVNVALPSWPKLHEEEIKRKALVQELTEGDTLVITRINAKN
jgi:hypothetical protein